MEIQTMAKLSKTLEANLRFDDNALETVANLTVTLRLLNMSDRAIDSGEHFKTIKEVLVSAMGFDLIDRSSGQGNDQRYGTVYDAIPNFWDCFDCINTAKDVLEYYLSIIKDVKEREKYAALTRRIERVSTWDNATTWEALPKHLQSAYCLELLGLSVLKDGQSVIDAIIELENSFRVGLDII